MSAIMAMAVSNNVRVSPIAVAANPPPSIEFLLVGLSSADTFEWPTPSILFILSLISLDSYLVMICKLITGDLIFGSKNNSKFQDLSLI
jgi:hypothetical protein